MLRTSCLWLLLLPTSLLLWFVLSTTHLRLLLLPTRVFLPLLLSPAFLLRRLLSSTDLWLARLGMARLGWARMAAVVAEKDECPAIRWASSAKSDRVCLPLAGSASYQRALIAKARLGASRRYAYSA